MGCVIEFGLNRRGVCRGSHKKFAINLTRKIKDKNGLHAVLEEVSKAP